MDLKESKDLPDVGNDNSPGEKERKIERLEKDEDRLKKKVKDLEEKNQRLKEQVEEYRALSSSSILATT